MTASDTDDTRRAALLALLDRFGSRRILVVGDLMADEHIWGAATRVSPEAPVLVVDVQRDSFAPGGAANVASQLLAFGAQVSVVGAVGDDDAGEQLVDCLQRMGARTEGVVAIPGRPTTRKTRVLAGNQQVVRIDREQRDPLPERAAAELVRRAEAALPEVDAVLFSDYEKGVLAKRTVGALLDAARAAGRIATANPKPRSAAWFRDADLVQLNRVEADQASHSHRFETLDEAVFHDAGADLRARLGVRNLLITRGAKGLTVFLEAGGHVDVAPRPVAVFDVAGAGDSTLAAATLGLAAGASVGDAVHLGNAAGGAVVRRVGVVSATRDEVAALL